MTTLRTHITGLHFPECPRWNGDRLWISDVHGHRVLSVGLEGDARAELDVPDQPGGIGWLPDGSLLVVSMRNQRVLRRGLDGHVDTYADLAGQARGHLNDMCVDASGVAFVGSYGLRLHDDEIVRPAPLLRVSRQGVVDIAAEGLLFPNGMAISLDRRTMYVAESFGNRIARFEIDPAGGLSPLAPAAVFGPPLPEGCTVREAFQGAAVVPDGIALDRDGALWVADAKHGRALHLAPTGEVIEVIECPLPAYAVALGGPNLRTLFICCTPSASPSRQTVAREGVVYAVTVPLRAVSHA